MVSAVSVQGRFYASFGTDSIFRLVDGATCPTDDVSSIEAKRQAYSLLMWSDSAVGVLMD